jgi:hypothetical protein
MHILLYLDPGTGSTIIQLIIAGLAAIGMAIKPMLAWLRRLRKKKNIIDDDE